MQKLIKYEYNVIVLLKNYIISYKLRKLHI